MLVTVVVIKAGLTPISAIISRTPVAWHKNHHFKLQLRTRLPYSSVQKHYSSVQKH